MEELKIKMDYLQEFILGKIHNADAKHQENCYIQSAVFICCSEELEKSL